MATKKGNHLSGRLGREIHYNVDGVERVRTGPKHVHQPGTDPQKAHWGSFVDIVRLSSKMADAAEIGLAHPARKKTKPYLLFRHINKKCFTPDGQIDYPNIILSHGAISRVGFTDIRLNKRSTNGKCRLHLSFDPCLQVGIAHPDDELYLYAFCPSLGAGLLFEPVPREAGKLTVALPADWLKAEVYLYAFLRCPGVTANTPEKYKPSARNRRGQTSPTHYIPLPTS